MKRLPIWFLLLTSAGTCTTRTTVSQSEMQVVPALTVQRFLQAANTRDLETMSRLFGTDDGPVGDRWSREEIELRMDVLAEILQHADYEIISERPVPGAASPSNRVGVDILILIPGGTTMVRDVGFTVVLASTNQWLINLIDVEKITGTP